MTSLDREVVRRKLAHIAETLEALRPLARLTLTEYLDRLYERKVVRILHEHLGDFAGFRDAVLGSVWATGRPIDVEDVLIGATALVRRLAVVTNNVAHFARIPNLRVVNWMG
jgi:predicted nucleic acid-binding protein